MVNATATSPAARTPLAPPVLPNYLNKSSDKSFSTAPQPVVAVKANYPGQGASTVDSGLAFRESPAIVRPDLQQKEATAKSKETKNKNLKMAAVGAGLFVGIMAISTGIWFMGQSQDVRQQAYIDDSLQNQSPSDDQTEFESQPQPSPTPNLLALANTKACGESCSSNNDCQSGHVCSSVDGFRCVLSACMETATSCDAAKCAVTSTPLGDGAGIGGAVTTLASTTSTSSATLTATRAATTRATQPTTTQAVPVSGSTTTTLALIGSGLLFIVSGAWMFVRRSPVQG